MKISPDDRWLIAWGVEDKILVWDLRSKNPSGSLILLYGHKLYVSAAEFSPDGQWLLTTCLDGMIRIWDMTSPRPVESAVVMSGERNPGVLAISADSRRFVTGGLERRCNSGR